MSEDPDFLPMIDEARLDVPTFHAAPFEPDRERVSDWRLWAAIAGALLLVVALIGFLVTLDSRNDKETQVEDLRTEVDTLSDQNGDLKDQIEILETQGETDALIAECRSRVAFETDREASQTAALTARALAAVGRGESPAPFAEDLDREAGEYEAAIAVRDSTLDALERGEIPDTCTEVP